MRGHDISTNTELQQIVWACHSHWKTQPLPVDLRGICHTGVSRVYRARFESTFTPQKLSILARLGILAKDDTSRGGSRRYYTIPNPEKVDALLREWSLG